MAAIATPYIDALDTAGIMGVGDHPRSFGIGFDFVYRLYPILTTQPMVAYIQPQLT